MILISLILLKLNHNLNYILDYNYVIGRYLYILIIMILHNNIYNNIWLAILSGKELFKYNAALFVDDDAAIDAKEENAMNNETKLRQEEEEKRQKEESERIQIEQERLAEMQLIELRIRKKKDEDRCIAAKASNRITFILGNIIINQVVFEDDEVEDLAPFPEEQFVEIEVNEPMNIEPLLNNHHNDNDDNENDSDHSEEENNNSDDEDDEDSEEEDEDDEVNKGEEEEDHIEENINSWQK